MTSGSTSRRLGLRAGHKLHTAVEFDRARRGRDRHTDAFFVIQCSKNEAGTARLGMAVSKRVAGSSVVRNRLRRLIRESFRMHREELPPVDVLVTARPAAAQAENRLVFGSLEELWDRVRANA